MSKSSPPTLYVHVVENGERSRPGWTRCELGRHLSFDTHALASYFFAEWEPVVYDALLLAAAIEFSDKSLRRVQSRWGRIFELHMPVHCLARWNTKVLNKLHRAIEFLTGDRWKITVYERQSDAEPPQQSHLTIPADIRAVIPYSDGLDSRAVGELIGVELGHGVVRVRLGKKTSDRPLRSTRKSAPFTAVPYKIWNSDRFVESSGRSRGFKFTMLSGVAAYLAKAPNVVMPESGQGALGPTLVVPGQAYEDYRNHPTFTNMMADFLKVLLGHELTYEYPRLWHTKGETLSAYVAVSDSNEWAGTRSCWQDNRHSSVDGQHRQCGVCAACMLRRMSIHHAGLKEAGDKYIWDDLTRSDFSTSAANGYKHSHSKAQREYAIAGALHMEHLAGLRHSSLGCQIVGLAAFQLAKALSMSEAEATTNLHRLLDQHTEEWTNFVKTLGSNSFVAKFAGRAV